jgi:aspartate aminotransferase
VAVLSTGDVRIPLHEQRPSTPRLADQRYRAAAGEPELRAAIAAGHGLEPAGVLVTPGARQALLLAFATLPPQRREILVATPYWASYPELARTVGATLRTLPDLDAVRAAAGPATGAVLVNSPRNPDGAVLAADLVAELAQWTAEAGIRLIFDQVYRGVPLPDGPTPSPCELPGGLPAHCLVVDGLSKSHALAGLRIGWLAADPDLVAPATKLASHLIGGTSSAGQDVAMAALAAGEEDRLRLGRQLAENRDYAVDKLAAVAGVRCDRPTGGIFLFPDLGEWLAADGRTPAELVSWLEREHQVAVVDGTAFGAPGHVRLSYALEPAQLRLGVDRLAAALAKPVSDVG